MKVINSGSGKFQFDNWKKKESPVLFMLKYDLS